MEKKEDFALQSVVDMRIEAKVFWKRRHWSRFYKYVSTRWMVASLYYGLVVVTSLYYDLELADRLQLLLYGFGQKAY